MDTQPALKSVLVTGGARRIGAEIARRFGEADWHVVIHCHRSLDEARTLAASLPSSEVVQCDLADASAAMDMVESLAARLEDWRVMIANASLFEEDGARALDPAVASRAWQANALAPAAMAQAFLARARSTAGRRVIQLTDQKLANPNPDFFSYTMSKFAVDAAAQMLAMSCQAGSCQPSDRVYRLAPGAILPSHDQTPAEAERSHRLNLLGRRTAAAEVADAALFLATAPLASGQALFVDSGQHLLSQPRDVLYLAREEQ